MDKFILILLVMLACSPMVACAAARAHATTTTAPAETQASPNDVDDMEEQEPIGILLFMLIIMLVLFGAGAVFAIALLVTVLCLASAGIVSTSILTGLVSRRPRTAIKAFFLQIGGVLGFGSGAGAALVATWLFDLHSPDWAVVGVGAVAGLIAGVVVAVLFNLAWDWLLTMWMQRRGSSSQTPAGSDTSGRNGDDV